MHRFLALPLRIHLLLLVVILTLPTLGIIIYSGFAQREAALREATRETVKLAYTIASEQENLVAGAEQLLSTLVLLPDIRNRNRAATSAILADLLVKNPHYANIFIADTSGTLWASAVPHAQMVSHAGYRYLKNVLATGRFSSGEYATGKITRKRVLHFGYPLKDPAGNVSGVATIALDMDYCWHLLAKAGLPEETTLTLLDHNGIVLSRSLNTQFIGSRDKEQLYAAIKAGKQEGTFKAVGLDGTARLFAYRKVYLRGEQAPYLYIRTGIPENAIVAQANAALRHNLLVLAPFPFIGMFIIWFVGKKTFVDRVDTLQKAAQRLAAGDMNIRVSTLVAGGELGALGAAFDDMAEKLARRESDLRESQRENAFLTGLLERSSQPFAIAYPDGRLGTCNPAFLNLVGYRSEELKTVDWARQLTPPEWFDSERARLAELDHADRPVRYEKEYLRKDGSRVQVELLTHLVRDGDGKPDFYYAFITDITERKRTEEELRTREEAFRLAFEGAKDAIFWADARSGILTNCNRAAEKMLEASRDEIIGRHQTILHPPDIIEVIATEFKRQVGENEGDMESFVHAKSGRKIPVHIKSSVTRIGSREIIQGIFRDISERVRMEQSLRESEELFRTLCDAAPIGIFREDCDGNNIYSNPRWEEISGLSATESLGHG